MPHRNCACVFVVLLALPAAFAGEMYSIRIKAPVVGAIIRMEKEETRTTRTLIHDGLGRKVLDHQDKEVETFVYDETILQQASDGKLMTLRRRYEKAQLKQGKTTQDRAFQGQTVLIRRNGGKFQFVYDGGRAVADADAVFFDREFNGGDEKFRLENLLPAKSVPVGADWRIDMGPLVKDFLRTGRFAVDASWATGNGRLNKSTPAGGSQFGQIVYRMEIPIQAMAVIGPDRLPVLSGSKATFELTMDSCIDGTRYDSTVLGTAEVKSAADLPQPGANPGRLTFYHKCDSRTVRKPGK